MIWFLGAAQNHNLQLLSDAEECGIQALKDVGGLAEQRIVLGDCRLAEALHKGSVYVTEHPAMLSRSLGVSQ